VIPLAFETAAGLASFDLSAGQVVPSVTPGLYDLIYKDWDRSFLSRISDGPSVDNTKFTWSERTQRPMVVVADADDLDAPGVETALTVAAGHAGRIVEGAILMDEADPTERLQVTAIAAPVLTVTRGYGGTTLTAHAADASYRIISMPAQEMSSTGLDLLRVPSEVSNYTQIFRRDLKASRSGQGLKTYSGYHLSAKRLQEKLEEIRDELEQTALFEVANATTPLGSDVQLRTTGGLFSFVTNIDATGYVNQSADDLKALIDAAGKELMEAGTDPNFVMAGGDIFGAIMDLDKEGIRYTLNDGVRGAQVKAIRTKYGPVLDLVYDRWLPSAWLCVGDYRKIQQRLFANGGTPHIEQLAKTKDGEEFMIIGELGYQVENGAEAFKLFSNVSVA